MAKTKLSKSRYEASLVVVGNTETLNACGEPIRRQAAEAAGALLVEARTPSDLSVGVSEHGSAACLIWNLALEQSNYYSRRPSTQFCSFTGLVGVPRLGEDVK